VIILHGVEVVVLGVFAGLVATRPTARGRRRTTSCSTRRGNVTASMVREVRVRVGSRSTVARGVVVHRTVGTACHVLSLLLCVGL